MPSQVLRGLGDLLELIPVKHDVANLMSDVHIDVDAFFLCPMVGCGAGFIDGCAK